MTPGIRRRGGSRVSGLLIAGLALFLSATAASAQEPPPDHASATSAPLFVQDLPVGTVSVRISRPTMTEAIANVDVVAAWTDQNGKKTSATVKTGEDGRAIFSGVAVGSQFVAHATVEGQALTTAEFTVPSEGGTRLLLIVGGTGVARSQADEPTDDETEAAPHPAAVPKPASLRAGNIEISDSLPAGSVDIRVIGPDGKPRVGKQVDLGHARPSATGMDTLHARTDDSGVAHFTSLPIAEGGHYAAVMESSGLRLGTDAFTLDAKHGLAGELREPASTDDLGVLRISASTRMMVELREEAVMVLQNLVVENASDKIFDPGPQGLFLPLPDGFTGAEKLPGGSDIEIREHVGVFLHSRLPPTQGTNAVAQVRVGYALTTHGEREFPIVQPMPIGLQGGLVMVPSLPAIELSAPGLRQRPIERDDNGNELRMYDMDAVAPGHALRLTVQGIPAHRDSGKWIALALVGLLIVGGLIAARRPATALSTGEQPG